MTHYTGTVRLGYVNEGDPRHTAHQRERPAADRVLPRPQVIQPDAGTQPQRRPVKSGTEIHILAPMNVRLAIHASLRLGHCRVGCPGGHQENHGEYRRKRKKQSASGRVGCPVRGHEYSGNGMTVEQAAGT